MAGTGFFAKGLRKVLGKGGRERTTPKGPDAPQQPAADAGYETPMAEQPGPTPTPINPEAGHMDRPMSAGDVDESIQELGAQGEMGAVEGAGVVGRTERRNINLDFYESDDTKRVLELINKKADGYKDNPARKVQTHAKTAYESAGSVDQVKAQQALERVLDKKLTDKFTPEDLVSIYVTADKLAKELQETAVMHKASRASGKEVPAEEVAHYKLLSTRLAAVMEVASVRGGEAGRQLNAMQAIKKLTNKQYLEEVQRIVKNNGGRATFQEQIDAMASANGFDSIVATNKQNWKAKTWNTALQVRYNMMLSSWRTHAANIGGSAATGVYEMVLVNPSTILVNNAEYGVRAVVNASLKAVGANVQLPAMERRLMSEMVSLPRAAIKNIGGGLATAREVYMGREMGFGKLYNEQGMRIYGGTDSYLSSKIQVATRALEAEDAFFKSIYASAQIEVLAKRQALNGGGTAAQINQKIKYLMKHPTDEMINTASDYARKLTFTSDPSIYGNLFKAINEGVASAQDASGLFELIVPFRNTPVNITGYVIENTPLGMAAAPRKFLGALAGKDPNARADAIGRLAISGGLMAYAHELWKEGKITGAAPSNYGDLLVRQAAGWEPNSIILDGKVHTLNRMDPPGLILGTYATFFEAMAMMGEDDVATAGAAAIVGVASMITDRSMLASFGDLERVFQSSEGSVGRQGGKLAARMLTAFVTPALLRDVREMKDPRVRAIDVPNEIVDATFTAIRKTVMNAAPYFSEMMPPQVDAWGEDRINTAGWFYRGIIPVKTTTIKQDPSIAALLAMQISLGHPDSEIKLPGSSMSNALPIDLLALDGNEGWLYRAYKQEIGKARRAAVDRYVSTANFQAAVDADMLSPDSLYAEELHTLLSKATRIAKERFIREILTGDSIQPMVAGEKIGEPIPFAHQYSPEQYAEFARQVTREGMTEEIRDEARAAGYKPIYKPETAGLPEQMKLQKTPDKPRF